MGLSIQQFDDLVELWDKEGQPPDIDWLEYAQDFRNRTAQLKEENERLDTNRKAVIAQANKVHERNLVYKVENESMADENNELEKQLETQVAVDKVVVAQLKDENARLMESNGYWQTNFDNPYVLQQRLDALKEGSG